MRSLRKRSGPPGPRNRHRYDRHGMRPRRLAALAMPIVVLAASQVGHLVASELRQGPGALAPDSSGAHAYVPALTSVALGLAGAAVLAALLVVAAARVAWSSRAARPGGRGRPGRVRRVSALDLSAVLFALQLAVFLGQETLEATARGASPPDATSLLLWGCLGQLPVALLAGLVLSWVGARFESAVERLLASAGQPLDQRPALPASPVRPPNRPSGGARRPAGAVSQRGPPTLLRPA